MEVSEYGCARCFKTSGSRGIRRLADDNVSGGKTPILISMVLRSLLTPKVLQDATGSLNTHVRIKRFPTQTDKSG